MLSIRTVCFTHIFRLSVSRCSGERSFFIRLR